MPYLLRHPLLALGRWYVRYLPGTFGHVALVNRLLHKGLWRHPYIGRTRIRTGERFHVDTTDLIQQYLHAFGVWEPHLAGYLRGRLGPDDVFVDIGANCGAVAIPAAGLVGPLGRVVAIEALPDFCLALMANAELNGLANIRTVNVAVSDRAQELTLYLKTSGNLGATSIIRPESVEREFRVPARPLAELLTEQEIAAVRVIKVDVEGAEGKVLAGLLPLLPCMRDDVEIVIEISPDRLAAQGQSVAVIDPLLATGFHPYRLVNDYRAQSYPAAVRSQPAPPMRWRQPTAELTEQCDLVFSRIDADFLTPAGAGASVRAGHPSRSIPPARAAAVPHRRSEPREEGAAPPGPPGPRTR